jgi:succinate dehydrogenase / fumarate reductase cytochrome b subunit
MNNVQRPISPHLTIYRKQITSVLSILHRITGIVLYFGTFLLIAFLLIVAYAPEQYESFHELLTSAFGRFALFGWTLAFFFHLLNGIRHLFWDMGKGFEIKTVNKTGWLVVVFTIILSLITWCIAYSNAGVL